MKTLYTLAAILLLSTTCLAQGLPPRDETNLDEVFSTYDLSGENVVVVIIDRGIDYRHPDFLDENGNTRVAYAYDMIDASGANDPNNPYGVGTIFDRAAIDAALDNNDPPLTTDRGGHGTATTGIAAGNGTGTASGDFQGVAHNATIISIKLVHDPFPPFGGEPGQSGFFDPTFIPIALQFAQDKIAELGLPSVTLMNLGSVGGPTDGTSAVCQAIDAFVQAGNTFVCGVGDDGGGDNHASATIAASQTIEIDVVKAETGNLRFDLWYSEDDRFTVRIERPGGAVEGPFAAPSGPNAAVDQNLGDIFMAHRGANVEFFGASSNRRELLIDFSGATGTYKVILEGAQITDGSFNATLNPANFTNNNRFGNFVVPGYSINDFSSANSAIVPTDYVVQNDWIDINGIFRELTGQGDAGEIWIGSSASPTQDGRLGVDFAIPGEVCHAAYADNTYYESFSFNVLQNSNGLYGVQNAVSAAAPLATGIIALMLEVNPQLTPAEIKALLRGASDEDAFTGAVPNDTWGYGKLDALQVIEDTFDTLNVEEFNTLNAVLYPNPTNGDITVRLNQSAAQVSMTVQNMLGQTVHSTSQTNTKSIQTQLPSATGIYFVSVTASGKGTKTFKVIKQ